jgi:hypothetical protein
MAMYINNEEFSQTTYYVGEYLSLGDVKINQVQADGDELLLCMRILRIEKIDNRVHIFVGDEAREIISNWNNYQKLYS